MSETEDQLNKMLAGAIDLTPDAEFIDASVEDRTVTVDMRTFENVVTLALEGRRLQRRFRKRDVLVAQAVNLLRTAQLDHALGQTYIDNVAERLIDVLGVAVLVEGDEKRNTAVIPTGEREEMSLEDFLAREGRLPQ